MMTNTEAIIEALMTLSWCWLESDLYEHSCELGRVETLLSWQSWAPTLSSVIVMVGMRMRK